MLDVLPHKFSSIFALVNSEDMTKNACSYFKLALVPLFWKFSYVGVGTKAACLGGSLDIPTLTYGWLG
jgi:hypothetical protein